MARQWVVFGYDEGEGTAWEVALALGYINSTVDIL